MTSNLICSYFEQAVRSFTGDPTLLRSLDERSLATAVAGSTLSIDGEVTAVEKHEGGTRMTCDLVATDQHDRQISTCRVELVTPGVGAAAPAARR